MARLAISKGFLADYVKLDKDVQRAVDQAVTAFARHAQPGLHLEKPQYVQDDRLRILPIGPRWRGVVLTAGDASPDTYNLVTVLPQDQADAYVTSYQCSVPQAALPQAVLPAPVPAAPAAPAPAPETPAAPAPAAPETPADAKPADPPRRRLSRPHRLSAWRRFRTGPSAS